MYRATAAPFLALFVIAPAASGQVANWVAAGPDSWHHQPCWSTGIVPLPSQRAAFPTGGQALVNATASCGELFLTFGTEVHVNAGATFFVNAGLLNNAAGRITLTGSATNSAVLSFADPATIIDDVGQHPFGQIELMAFDESRLFSGQMNNGTSGVLTFEGTTEVHGTGLVQAELINNSTRGFFATIPGRTLDLGSRTKTNNGLFAALDDAILRLASVVDQGPAGVIEADGGVVLLDNVTITGGTVRSLADGVVFVGGGGTLESVDFSGVIEIPGGSSLSIRLPGITSAGTIRVNSDEAAARATLVASSSFAPGAAMLDGAGEVVLAAQSEGNLASAALVINTFNELVVHADHTIRGTGRIEGNGLLTNNGLVLSDAPGRTLVMQSGLANNALVRAAGDSGITIDSGQPWNQTPAAAIEVHDGPLKLTRCNISQGAIRSTGAGVALVTGIGNPILLDVEVEIPVHIPSGELLDVRGLTMNNSTITVNSDGGGAAAFLELGTDSDAVTGTGEIVLSAPNVNSLASARISVGSFDTFTQGPGHTLRGNGQLSGTNCVMANQGTIAPGFGPGRIDMSGVGFTQEESGRLEIELGGTMPVTGHDQLTSSRQVNLDGTLAVSLSGGFSPQPMQTFKIVMGVSVSGEFSSVESPPGVRLRVVYNAADVTIEVLCPGDFNADGVRNTADFFEFFAGFFGSPPSADYNGDGLTNTADFFEFFADFFGPPCL